MKVILAAFKPGISEIRVLYRLRRSDRSDIDKVFELMPGFNNIDINGKVIDVNSSLEDNPEVVNDDPYGEGWIIKIEVSNPSDIDALMNSEEYKNLIGS